MRKFQPIYNVILTYANCEKQAEQIVSFLNAHADELSCAYFYVENGCNVLVNSIKPSRIAYLQGVIAGYLLSK